MNMDIDTNRCFPGAICDSQTVDVDLDLGGGARCV